MSTNKVNYSDLDIKYYVFNIIRDMIKDNWRPDYIVGLTRGGLVPAVLFSQYLDVRMETLKVSFRDGEECETNLWMAEDAIGCTPEGSTSRYDPYHRKNILIVDDINDSGRTLQWIKDDWRSGAFPNDSVWDTVWGYNVRVAVMINNTASEFKDVDYVGKEINKNEHPEWCVFPWENWWG
jgi:hypoxanthine phosphoribosyltransferase